MIDPRAWVLLAVPFFVGAATLRVGVPLARPGPYRYFADQMEVVANMWATSVNAQSKIGDVDVHVELEFVDVGNQRDTVTREVDALAARSDILLAPYSSTLTEVAAPLAEKHGTLMISGGASSLSLFQCPDSGPLPPPCTSHGARRFNYLASVLSVAPDYFKPWVSLIKLKTARSLALLMEDTTFTRSACQGAREEAAASNIDTVYEVVVPKDAALTAPDVLEEVVREFVAQQQSGTLADGLLGCVYVDTCIRVVQLLSEYDVNFNAVAMSICVGHPRVAEELGEKALYISGSSQWDARLTGPDYQDRVGGATPAMFVADATSPALFAHAFEREFGDAPTYQAANSMASLYLLHAAIAHANSTTSGRILHAMPPMRETSFFGAISQSSFGTNFQKPMVTLQYTSGDADSDTDTPTAHIVSPLAAAHLDFIYPMPAWAERRHVHAMYTTGEEKAVIAVACVSACLALLLAFAVAVQKAHPVVRRSTAPVSVAILLGCTVCFFAPLSWSLEESLATCRLRPWLFFGATSLPLAPLLAKLVLVCRQQCRQQRHPSFVIPAVTTPSSKAGAGKDTETSEAGAQPSSPFASGADKFLVHSHHTNTRELLTVTTVLVSPQLLLCLLWSGSAAMEWAMEVPDPLRPALSFSTCLVSSSSAVFSRLSLTYSGLLLVSSVAIDVYLRVAGNGRRIRDSFLSRVNVLFALCMLAFGFGLSMILTHLNSSTRAELFVMRSLSAILAVHLYMWTLLSKTLFLMIHSQFVPASANTDPKSVHAILASPVRRAYMRRFMRQQYAEENMKFVEAVIEWKRMHDRDRSATDIHQVAQDIVEQRIEPGSDEQVNLSAGVRESTMSRVRKAMLLQVSGDADCLPRNLFDPAMMEIAQIIETNSLSGFLRETHSHHSEEVVQWCMGASLLGSEVIQSVIQELELLLEHVRHAERRPSAAIAEARAGARVELTVKA